MTNFECCGRKFWFRIRLSKTNAAADNSEPNSETEFGLPKVANGNSTSSGESNPKVRSPTYQKPKRNSTGGWRSRHGKTRQLKRSFTEHDVHLDALLAIYDSHIDEQLVPLETCKIILHAFDKLPQLKKKS